MMVLLDVHHMSAKWKQRETQPQSGAPTHISQTKFVALAEQSFRSMLFELSNRSFIDICGASHQ